MQQNSEKDIARLYHLNSSSVRGQVGNAKSDNYNRPPCFRTYPGTERVRLTGGDFDFKVPLGKVLQHRRSIREFYLMPLELAVVGRLLYSSYGVRGYRHVDGQWLYDRPLPSAGGLYPLELYVALRAVVGIVDGIYHYDARAHELELLQTGIFHTDIANVTFGQQTIGNANLIIMISAVFQRNMRKYGQRGYRYVLLDAGHLGQNLYLNAIALGLGPVAIGGFFDHELNNFMKLPVGEEIIYLICIGHAKEEIPDLSNVECQY